MKKTTRVRTCTMAEAIEVHRLIHPGCFDYVFLDPSEFLRLPLNGRNAWDQLYAWIESKGYLDAAELAASKDCSSALDRVVAGRMFLQSMIDRRRVQLDTRRKRLERPGFRWETLVKGWLRTELNCSGPKPSLIISGHHERQILGVDLVVLRGVCPGHGLRVTPPEVAAFLGATR